VLRKLSTLATLLRHLALLPDIAARLRRLEQAEADLAARRPQAAEAARRLAEGLDRVERGLAALARPPEPPPRLSAEAGRERRVTLASGEAGIFVPLTHPDALRPRPPSHVYEAVARRIARDRAATDAFLDALGPLLDAPPLDAVPRARADETGPYWDNGWFSGDDARLLVAYIGTFRPRLLIEIGSGNSTKFARLAATAHGTGTRIVSVDPEPRAAIDGISDVVLRRSVLEVDLAAFAELGPGDLLFHDGSHLAMNGTDTVRLFLEILPRLRPGVVVHLHDIALPREYPAAFDGRGYGEQYMLATALLAGEGWEVLAPVAQLHAAGRLRDGGTSFWMRRRG
jgi:hypothetical protein